MATQRAVWHIAPCRPISCQEAASLEDLAGTMSNPVIEVLILAAVALFVLWRLYAALGRGGNDRPMQRPAATPLDRVSQPQQGPATARRRDIDKPVFTGPAAGGLEDIYNADAAFSPDEFLRGARAAYQMIVGAYARGDRESLKPLLDGDVYEAWDRAMAERDANGEKPFELLRIKRLEIERAELDGRMARVSVRYEAELGDGETTRLAREIWTYKRDVSSPDPNWLLDDVDVAG